MTTVAEKVSAVRKQCSCCKQEYPTSHFHKNRTKHDGLSNQCCQCKRVSNHRREVRLATERQATFADRFPERQPHPCVVCGETFSPRRAGGNTQIYCSTKCKERRTNQIRYHRNPQRANDAIREWQADRTRRLVEYLKTHPCTVCGEADPVVLEFHHIDPSNKRFTVGAIYKSRTWSVVQTEIEKCIVLCANCHRRVEHGTSHRAIASQG